MIWPAKIFSFFLTSLFFLCLFGTAQAALSSRIGFETQSYFYRGSDTQTTRDISLTEGSLKGSWLLPKSEFGFDMNVAASFGGGGKQAYADVPEAFGAYRMTENFQVGVGRRLFTWSSLDSDWKTGFFQPLSSQDPLRTIEGGLSGMHLDYQGPQFSWTVVASAFYIPTLGPEIREQDGQIVSPSPWFRSPRDTVYLNEDVPTRIKYKIDMPEAKDLIYHGGAASRVLLGDRKQGTWAQVAWAYQPMSQLVYEYDRSLRTLASGSPHAEVQIAPRVVYHQVRGLETGWSSERVQFYASYMEDTPGKMNPTAEWVYQRIDNARVMGAGAQYVPGYLNGVPVALGVGVMKIENGRTFDVEVDGAETSSLLGNRFLFSQAAKVSMSGSFLQIFKKNLYSSFQYLFDKDQEGGWFNMELKYYPQKYLALHLGGDVLGVTDKKAPLPEQFLNQYRSNDRLYTGVSYVF